MKELIDFRCLPKKTRDKSSAIQKRKITNNEGGQSSSPTFVKINVAPQMKVAEKSINSAFQDFTKVTILFTQKAKVRNF